LSRPSDYGESAKRLFVPLRDCREGGVARLKGNDSVSNEAVDIRDLKPVITKCDQVIGELTVANHAAVQSSHRNALSAHVFG
jgi:hypothetical protein